MICKGTKTLSIASCLSFKDFVTLSKFLSHYTVGPQPWLHATNTWGALKHTSVWVPPEVNQMGISGERPGNLFLNSLQVILVASGTSAVTAWSPPSVKPGNHLSGWEVMLGEMQCVTYMSWPIGPQAALGRTSLSSYVL